MPRDAIRFLRANPQAAILLFICIVLGLGTMIAVLIAVGGSSSTTGASYPDGSVINALAGAFAR